MPEGVPAVFREPDYRLRRGVNWLTIGVLYALFYMTRYNFSAVAPSLRAAFGWAKHDLGIFETVMPLVYGLSVVINGPIADRVGGKRAFLFGAVGVVLMNFLFGAAHLVAGDVSKDSLRLGLAVVWGLNGYFQSFGALSIVKVNAQWFHIRERGTFAAIFGILIRFGLILAFSGAPWIVQLTGKWYWAFWGPAILVALIGLATLLFVKDTPAEAGYPGRNTGEEAVAEGERVSVVEVLRKVFASKVMWMIAGGSMMIGFVRRSVVDAWWPVYLKEVHGITSGTSLVRQVAAWGIAIMGILGGFAFGISSDRIFGGRRGPVVAIGFGGMAAVLALFYLSDSVGLGVWSAVAWLLLLSFFVNGAHGMIGGAASMDFGGRKAAATAAGLFDGMQYVAGAFVGLAVGYITELPKGWQYWKLWPIPFAGVGMLLMARLWNTLPGSRRAH